MKTWEKVVIILLFFYLFMSSAISPLQTTVSAAGLNQGFLVFNGANTRESPVKINDYLDLHTGNEYVIPELQGSIICTNPSDVPIKNVSVTLLLQDDQGKPVWKKDFRVGSLAPGASSKTLFFATPNPTGLTLGPRNVVYYIKYREDR